MFTLKNVLSYVCNYIIRLLQIYQVRQSMLTLSQLLKAFCVIFIRKLVADRNNMAVYNVSVVMKGIACIDCGIMSYCR